MKDLLEQLLLLNKELGSIEIQVETIKRSPFYKVFGTEQQRQDDLEIFRASKKEVLNHKHLVLENIQLEANKELQRISTPQAI